MKNNLFAFVIVAVMAILLPLESMGAISGDVAYQVAELLGPGLTIKNDGSPADAGVVRDYLTNSRSDRSQVDFWHYYFIDYDYYDAEISCFKRNDGRYFVVHTISKVFDNGSYKFHGASFYIYDGRKLYPVKDLPCNFPVTDADFSDGLGYHNYLHADSNGGKSQDDWARFLSPSNIEYRMLTDRNMSILVHDGTQSHRIVELQWNGDKFLKRLGDMQVIHNKDFAGIFVGDKVPSAQDLGDVSIAIINEQIYILKKGNMDIARIELRKDVIDRIVIFGQGYCTENGYAVGSQLDTKSVKFVSRIGNDVLIDESGVQYRIDNNNVCREITIKQ